MNAPERHESTFLRQASRLVPASDRSEWSRFWRAELWHRRHARRARARVTDLYAGLLRDALWLRTESWQSVLRGTATLCLLTLALACTAAGLAAVLAAGGWHTFTAHLSLEFSRFLFATPLVMLVTYLTASRRPVHTDPSPQRSAPRSFRLYGAAFFAAKSTLLFALAYLLSTAFCAPLALSFPNTAAFLQIPLFVVLSVLALRWTFEDQERRCKSCLRLLDAPARIGRPSHNLLEWNGTALLCKRGHGVLSIPELETSWHQSSEWTRI